MNYTLSGQCIWSLSSIRIALNRDPLVFSVSILQEVGGSLTKREGGGGPEKKCNIEFGLRQHKQTPRGERKASKNQTEYPTRQADNIQVSDIQLYVNKFVLSAGRHSARGRKLHRKSNLHA